MTSNVINTTQSIARRVFENFGLNEMFHKEELFSSIVKDEINKNIRVQKNDVHTSANSRYENAGFKATNITSLIVQNQIATGAL